MSNALVVAVIVIMFTRARRRPWHGYGPHSLGWLDQQPAVTVPPGGV